MYRRPIACLTDCLALTMAISAGTAWAAGKAHEHGAVKLDLAIEGNQLTIDMQAPLDNLLGFERAPRNDAERRAAADVLARLRSRDNVAPLFVADAAARCSLSRAAVQAPVLEPGEKSTAKDGHADVEASYEFSCVKPDELRSLEVRLFDAYQRIQRIDVQVVGPKGQSKVTLKRPARSVQLVR
jgi:Protein of unknown function (DUF2796)